MNDTIKFLIIRFSSIGDIVLTTPVIRCLKEQVENAEVHYLTKPQFSSVLKNNPYIDKLHILKEDLNSTISDLKNEDFNYIIDLHHNLRTLRIKQKLNKIAFSFDKLNIKKWLIVNFKINKLPNIHIVDRYLKTLELFDVNNDDKGLDYFIDESEKVNIKEFPKKFHDGYVALVIGAKHETKKLPENKLLELVGKIKRPIILLGGNEDYENGEILTKDNSNIFNTCGQYSINQSASLIEQSDIVISHDTGLMHIASAYKKKTISIWGNTIPEFGMHPYLPSNFKNKGNYWIFEVDGLGCRPCSKIGYKKCPKKHFKCMQNIDIDKIVELVNNRTK